MADLLVWWRKVLGIQNSRDLNAYAGIEYAGLAGVSASCLDAVRRLLQFGERIIEARILTSGNSHCLFLTYDIDRLIAIKSGFSSGYGGEGPSSFADVLFLLYEHGVEIEEYLVASELLERLDCSALSGEDVVAIMSARPVRPRRFFDYIAPFGHVFNDEKTLSGWERFPSVLPFKLIDPRIRDLSLVFDSNPDGCLLAGYRRLEDLVRKRTGLNEHGAKLFSQAFVGPDALLVWKYVDQSVRSGRGNLFVNTYIAYRNPRAHVELGDKGKSILAEFLLLNHLFLLEGEALDPVEAERQVAREISDEREIAAALSELRTRRD